MGFGAWGWQFFGVWGLRFREFLAFWVRSFRVQRLGLRSFGDLGVGFWGAAEPLRLRAGLFEGQSAVSGLTLMVQGLLNPKP